MSQTRERKKDNANNEMVEQTRWRMKSTPNAHSNGDDQSKKK